MLCNKIYVDNNVYTCNFEKHINLSRILENK